MPSEEGDNPRLPLPKWFFLLLGVPIFYMPLAWFTSVICVLGCMLIGWPEKIPPAWLAAFAEPSLYVTFAMWPVYVAWVVFSKRLTLREKGLWLAIVVFLNMLGMPWFYIFMVRRYLGIEARPTPHDEAALDAFLRKCGVERGRLSVAQLGVLRSYCRTRRQAKSGVLLAIAAALLMICSAIVFSKNSVPMLSDLAPTRLVVVDTARNKQKETSPDLETQRLHVQVVMMVGTQAGMMGAMGLFLLVQAISLLWGTPERRVLIDFTKKAARITGGDSLGRNGSRYDDLSREERPAPRSGRTWIAGGGAKPADPDSFALPVPRLFEGDRYAVANWAPRDGKWDGSDMDKTGKSR